MSIMMQDLLFGLVGGLGLFLLVFNMVRQGSRKRLVYESIFF